MPRPKFTIVIPTVDRHELLEKTIAACLLSPYPNLEVLVSDNFSTPETAKVVESFHGDPRVRYVRTTRRLSMPDHWEFAWQQSKGDYIIINGDDDALSPNLIGRLAEIAVTFNAALMSWDAGLYYHPDWNLSGRNTFSLTSSHSRLLFDIKPQAVFASYARLEIPICFPHGTRICFSRRLADRAVVRAGRLFWGPFPDYSAPLLLLGLLQNERYIYWDALMGYGGRSRHSNAAAWERQGFKVGSVQRVTDFFDEFQGVDIYPNSELKIRALLNGYAETLNLLRHLLPEVFSPYNIDLVALIVGIELEFCSITHSPFLGPRERMEFDTFVAKQDPAIVEQAMEIVRKRKIDDSIEAWRLNRSRVSWPIIAHVLRPGLILRIFRLAMMTMRSLFVRGQQSAPSAPGAAKSNFELVVKQQGAMAKVDCSSFGGKDGLDLVRRLEDVVTACDRREVNNLVDFFNKGFLVAAYEADHLAGRDSPAKIVESVRS